jgi:hypothetical protein
MEKVNVQAFSLYENLFGENKRVCGDTFLIRNFVYECGGNPDELLEEVAGMKYVDRAYPGIMYRGNMLNRAKFFFYDRLTCPVGIPWYGYPGATYLNAVMNTTAMSAEVCPKIMSLFRECQGIPGNAGLNHCIGTAYTKPNDNIGAHSDKEQDLEPGRKIIIVSLGANRPLVLKNKVSEEVVTLYPRHGDAVILGWKTNQEWTHQVDVEPKPVGMGDQEWAEVIKPRYSLCFRTISTILSPEVQEKKLRETAKSKASRDKVKEERKKAKF